MKYLPLKTCAYCINYLKLLTLLLLLFNVLVSFMFYFINFKKILRVGELNPGLPRDRRGYSPLY